MRQTGLQVDMDANSITQSPSRHTDGEVGGGPGRVGERWRAVYASNPWASRGRVIDEPPSEARSDFQRDRDRIIHSSAFRRLKHKTQVFVAHEGDDYRTRLTHSLEVAQIARSISRTLGLDEDLAETLALAHDLGHPPFGHAGESALAEAMADFGGFDHNANTLRLVTEQEARYAEFDGLNLTWETLEGIVKHNGPVTPGPKGHDDLPWALTSYPQWRDLELHSYAGPEAQVAALADDIAYNNHDIDDGLREGLFALDDLRDVPLIGPVVDDVCARYPNAEEDRVIHGAVRRLIGVMVKDLVRESRQRLAAADPQSADEVRQLDHPVVAFSPQLLEQERHLRAFLFENVYRHYKVNRKMSRARVMVAEVFGVFLADPSVLPTKQRQRAGGPGALQTARVVADYIAGMTDRMAVAEHGRLFSLEPDR